MRIAASFTALALASAASIYVGPTAAHAQVTQECDNNMEGPRKSMQCTFTQPQLGIVWKGSADRARKLYFSKPAGDTGQDRIRWWFKGELAGEMIINPGDKGYVLKKKRKSTVVTRAEVETLKLPASGGSKIYIHFETLDHPQMPDLSSCSNTASADRASVCWTGNF